MLSIDNANCAASAIPGGSVSSAAYPAPASIATGDGGAQRHRLARADVPVTTPSVDNHHAEADPGDRLGVRLAGEAGH